MIYIIFQPLLSNTYSKNQKTLEDKADFMILKSLMITLVQF